MISAISSAVGAVTLTSDVAGSSFVWSKNGHAFSTTATGTVVDSYPVMDFLYYDPLDASIAYTGTFVNFYNAAHLNVSKNYRKSLTAGDKITITTNALNIGFYFDTKAGAFLTAMDNEVQFKVDGVVKWNSYLYTRYQAYDFNKIQWGTELDGATHTIEITLLSGEMIFGGYKASHFKAHYNDNINYSVVVDGVTTETITHFAKLYYTEVFTTYAASVLAMDVNTTTAINCLVYISRLASLFETLQDPTLRTKALAFLTKIQTSYLADGGALDVSSANSIVWCGRIPLYVMPAYKAFGDVAFLNFCDYFTGIFRNTWATTSADITLESIHGGGLVHLDRVWGPSVNNTNIHSFVNWTTAPCASALTCYLEPDSVYYQDSVLLDMVHRNMVAGLLNYCPSNGRLTEGYAGSLSFETMYGTWEFTHIELYYRSVPDRVVHSGILLSTIRNNVATWLSSYGDKWPFVYESQSYVHSNSPAFFSFMQTARHATNSVSSRWMLDLMFTANGGVNEWLNFYPLPSPYYYKVPLWDVNGNEIDLYNTSGEMVALHDLSGKRLNYLGAA